MDSIEPAPDREHIDHIVEVERCFLEACCEPSHVLHFAEEPLDDIAHGIEVGIVFNGFARV